jgi:hypothetical protein
MQTFKTSACAAAEAKARLAAFRSIDLDAKVVAVTI